MKNIINIMKFDIKNKKVPLIIGGAVILFFIIQFSTLLRWIPAELAFIPVISVTLVITLITSIVSFMKSISNNEGKLLFLTPIKGSELIIAKYLEFIGEGVAAIVLVSLGTIIAGGNTTLVIVTATSILFGLLVVFILITSLTTILKSYFSNVGICILLTVIAMVVFGMVISVLELIAYMLLPGIYIIIGEFFELSIFNILINIAAFGTLIFLSKYHIDNKLDIV